MELLGECLKIVKHTPPRWLSLISTLERIIRLWHVLRKHHADMKEVFQLE